MGGSENQKDGRVLQGVAASPGYSIGHAHLLDRRRLKVPKYHVSEDEIDRELSRFDDALEQSDAQIMDIRAKLESVGEEHVLILEAHQLMLKDEMLVEGTRQLIREQLINAEWALKKVVRSIKQIFDNIDDEYFRERRSDVDFVGDRVMRNLMGTSHPSLSQMQQGSIVVAHELSPADTAFMTRTTALGFATDVGGKTSHTAIMARSLELPAVVALENATELIGSGDLLVVDGTAGQIIVNPSREQLERYQKLQIAYRTQRAALSLTQHLPAKTLDGTEIRIAGNIELPEEADIVLEHGASGVGLYRTEYLYMNRETLPDEDEQYRHYRQVLESCAAHTATIRTLDLGGDKFITPLKLTRELNPAMGLRAIRFCLKEQGIFRTQLRALLRASLHGNLRIMVPLISGLSEVHAVKRIVGECREALEAEGHIIDDVPLGIMVELPSAAITADLLAREVDFFAIGTNDLIQYTLAIDRGNEHVAHLYRPLHPAVLRMLTWVVKAADDEGIRVSICGEMAGEALYTPVLLGLGLRELSMNAVAIPLVKSVIRAVKLADCQALYEEIRVMVCTEAIDSLVRERVAKLLKGAVPREVFDPSLS